MKITTETMMAKSPCLEYTKEKVSAILGDGKTLKEILEMEDIPAKDRVWATVQFLPNIENRKFAIWCARRVNRNNVSKITRHIDAVEEFYIFGTMTKTEFDECREAYNAADTAADTAADWAAEYAAYRAADDAAESAADTAADWAAGWAAYRAADDAADYAADTAADWAASWEADWATQIEYLKEVAERLSA